MRTNKRSRAIANPSRGETPAQTLSEVAERENLKLDATLARLAKAGITTSQAALAAPDKLKAALGKDARTARLTLGLIKLTQAAGDATLAAKAVKAVGPSLGDLGRMPFATLARRLGKLDAKQAVALRRLHWTARLAARAVAENGVRRSMMKSAAGNWMMTIGQPVKGGKPIKGKLPTLCFDCACCDSVFGPRAYLFDLLDLIFYRWPLFSPGTGELRRITSDMLEMILLQAVDSLTCDQGEQVLPQVRIACEVLEQFLKGKLPIAALVWQKAWHHAWTGLLGQGSDDIAPATAALRALAAGAASHPAARLADAMEIAAPNLAAIDQASSALRSLAADPAAAALTRGLGPGLEFLDTTVGDLLVAYRSALVAASGLGAETLGASLFIDLDVGACALTTRYTQLIVSLQSFILAIRTGDIRTIVRPDLPAALIRFDSLDPEAIEEEEWAWLGSYTTWKAAMYALVFPENALPPPLLKPPLKPLADIWASGVTPRDVREGFLTVFFGPLLNMARSFGDPEANAEPGTRFRARRVFDMDNFGYGTLDAWIADVRTLAQAPRLQATASSDEWPPASSDRLRFLDFPLLAAWALNRAGEFAAAHDWLRRLWDPNRPPAQRARYDFDAALELAPGDDPDAIRSAGADWLDDPLDPKLIARRRRGVYLRHAVLAMARNLVDWADHEYAHEDAESLARAHDLYRLARRALDAPELDRCRDALSSLEMDIVTRQDEVFRPSATRAGVRAEVRRLSGMQGADGLERAVRAVTRALDRPGRRGPVAAVRATVDEALARDKANRPIATLGQSLNRRRALIGRLEDEGVFGFTPDPDPNPGPGDGPNPRPPGDRFPPDGGFDDHPVIDPDLPDDGKFDPGDPHLVDVPTAFDACIPENPALTALRRHIGANLGKLAACLSIVGEPLSPALVTCNPAAGVAAPSGLPATDLAPRYRYNFLADKARQYLDVAQRTEQALLTALEKREQARFDILKARQASDLAGATVELRTLQVGEARAGQTVAELQVERADDQANFWDNRLGDATTADQTLSAKEKDGLFWMDVSWKLQAGAAIANAAMVLPQIAGAIGAAEVTAAGGVVSVATATTGVGAVAGGIVAGAGVGALGLSVFAGLPGIAGALSAAGGAAGTYANLQQTRAGYERRFEEWTLQRDLARDDRRIAEAGIAVAAARVASAEQDEEIARLQLTQAQEVLEFLRNRFDNVELFEWMIDVLMRNYRTLMQVATGVARLAQRALEFERQEPVRIVLQDYWSITNTSALAASLSAEQSSIGLLGAERLATDLTRLDAFKLTTETRRLQLTKTISLSQMLPVEFAELRRDGKTTFNTLLDWFDRDFPGHYLRLVRSVKVSVLALVPPLDGMHAMLHNGGESTVVVGETDQPGGLRRFVRRRALRNFGESVALDAAFSESGLFELRSDDPMLLPFEGLGVETQWTLEMPRAFNRFDFGTIADVLIQIDYTALEDRGYRAEVLAALPARETVDSSFDLAFAFPDGWYQVRNPRPADPPADRSFEARLPRAFFPPQFEADGAGPVLSLKHAALLVVGDFTQLAASASARSRLRNLIRDGFELEKDGVVISTAATPASTPAFRSAAIDDRSLVLTTRTALSALSPSEFAADFDATGGWTVRFKQPLFEEVDGDGRPLADRIVNALLVLTVEGKVVWK